MDILKGVGRGGGRQTDEGGRDGHMMEGERDILGVRGGMVEGRQMRERGEERWTYEGGREMEIDKKWRNG